MEHVQLSDKEKLQQLRAMVEVGKMEKDDPSKEFKELLSSLSIEVVKHVFLSGGKNPYLYPFPQVTDTIIEASRYEEENNTLLQVRQILGSLGSIDHMLL